MLFLDAKRNGYTPNQCGRTMTVGELMGFLSDFSEDTKIYLRNDRGYTYGSITDSDFEEVEIEDEEERREDT